MSGGGGGGFNPINAVKDVAGVGLAPMTFGASLQMTGGEGGIIDKGGKFIGGAWDDLTGKSAADAAGLAALAQAREARLTREEIMKRSDALETDAMKLAKMSPEELYAYGASLTQGYKQLDADQKLLDAIDPTLMEASQKVLKLLRGEGPSRGSSLDALKAERGQQRQQLIDRLRDQLGPGAETSSVGLKALRDFDIASSADLARTGQQFEMNDFNMRQGELQGLGQIMGVTSAIRPDLFRSGANIQNLSSTFKNRELNTLMNTRSQGISALAGASAPVIQTAGAQYVGDQLAAQGRQALFGSLLNIGATAGAKKLFGT